MIRRFARLLPVAALLLSASCKERPPAPPPGLSAPAPVADAPANPAGAPVRRIAVSHVFAVALPSGEVQRFEEQNLADCLAAGGTVLTAQVNRLYNGDVQASISVRIPPDKYAAFAAKIVAAPARLIHQSETAEDQTAAFLDVEKRLAAQTALRDRLTGMLQKAGTTVAEVIAIEKQLADVQATIESQTAQRDYLRTITDTVKVDVSYASIAPPPGTFDSTPVREAIDGFSNGLMASVAALIVVSAAVLPWLPVAGLLVWGVRRLLRRRRAPA